MRFIRTKIKSAFSVHSIPIAITVIALVGCIAVAASRVDAEHLSYPNLSLRFDAGPYIAAITQEANSSDPVRDWIAGARIVGTSQTTGNVQLSLKPNNQCATIEARFNGVAHARTTGYKGRFAIHSQSTTQLSASKLLKFKGSDISALPAVGWASTNSRITGVSGARLRLARRIAMRKANNMRPHAERVSAQKAKTRLENRMDKMIGAKLNEPQVLIQERLIAPLQALGLVPNIKTSSTLQSIMFGMKLVGDHLFGSSTRPPKLDSDHPLELAIHPSMINNLAAASMGGRTFTDKQIEGFIDTAYGTVPSPLRVGVHKDDWGITLSENSPFVLEIDKDNTLNLKLKIAGAFRGHERQISGPAMDWNQDVVSTVSFRIEALPTGPHFVRQGKVELNSEAPIPLELRELLVEKLNGLFGEDVYFDGLTPPAGGTFDTLARGNFESFDAVDGWAVLSWSMPGPSTEEDQ